MDLFEQIERFFTGVVFFVYNAVSTTFRLIRMPMKGPLRLYLRYRSRRHRQMGGLTYLFVSFFLLLLGIELVGASNLTDARRAFFDRGDIFAGGIVLAGVVSAILATVVVDASLRLFLRSSLPTRPLRAEAAVHALEFSFLWPMLALAAITVLWGMSSRAIPLPGHQILYPVWVVAVGLPLLLASLVPPVALVRSAIRGASRSRGTSAWRYGLTGLGIASLAIVSFLIGTHPIRMRWEDRSDAFLGTYFKEERVALRDLRCHVTRTRAYADALLENVSNSPLLFNPMEARVKVWGSQSGDGRFLFTPVDNSTEAVTLLPGVPTPVRIWLRPSPQYVRPADPSCHLTVAARRGEGSLLKGDYPSTPVDP